MPAARYPTICTVKNSIDHKVEFLPCHIFWLKGKREGEKIPSRKPTVPSSFTSEFYTGTRYKAGFKKKK